ncbi:hypothetical protein ACFX13_034501 [Malus domestica]|uniref:Leucine-rich repeat-containing N-terminal plant-type domain-containing protein n=1 Tax=Malus domestica TaxID=3750 RepID=A0A498K2J0_MALDO|nr:LRR receptor-like serine/threonine-protein kinase FLS2 [Malus domestica]RXI02389.1 hypothetical protein DVH24_030318 [Malus domestica]
MAIQLADFSWAVMVPKSTSKMMIKFLLVLLISLSTVLAEGNACNPMDLKGLTDFKAAIHNDIGNRLASWVGHRCCMWKGITCDNRTGRVTEINLPASSYGARLEGSLSASVTLISFLQVLDIGGNPGLVGEIPQSLGSLKNLFRLSLVSNRLSGSIPESVASLTNLVFLDLRNNSLTGHIPQRIGQLQALLDFDVSRNRLSGKLPPSMANLSSVVTIWLHNNFFEGPIPVLKMPSLKLLLLANNSLTGSIPTNFGDLIALREVNLSNNKLEGAIPESLGNLSMLLVLELQQNRFSGKIPDEFLKLGNLEELNLSNNHLVGKIPEGKPLSDFPKSSYSGNTGLCGKPLTPCKPI